MELCVINGIFAYHLGDLAKNVVSKSGVMKESFLEAFPKPTGFWEWLFIIYFFFKGFARE
jgi:hypothetical protein